MPLLDPNLQSTWESSYTGGYTRDNARLVELVKADAAALREALGVQAGEKIVMFGSGFGWEAEEWIAAGLGPIVCCDYSTWIQVNRPGNATVTILNEDGSTAASQRSIRAAAGVTGNAKCDWAISLDMAPWLTDDECARYATAMRTLATRCAHFISCALATWVNYPPQGNWKTIETWKALLTPDLIVSRTGMTFDENDVSHARVL